MTVKEIVEKYLKDNGYDGLFSSSYECGCRLGDGIMPCFENCVMDFQPGYLCKSDDPDCDWCIGAEKEKDND